jgi:SAM-dependent methyltransferase
MNNESRHSETRAAAVGVGPGRSHLPSVDSLRRRFYPDVAERDPVARFVRRLEQWVRPGDIVLDIGAGTGQLNAYDIKRSVRQLVGVDLDPRVGANALLDSGVRGDMFALPFRNGSFDVVFSIYVLEHVGQPAALVADMYRVLRPGGICLALTPNLFHYVTLASRLSPTGFHRWINEKRGRPAADTFPTCYRLNSRGTVKRQFETAGFETVAIDAIEVQPNYLTMTALTYAMGIAYERAVNATERLSAFRVNLITVFRKPGPAGDAAPWRSVQRG